MIKIFEDAIKNKYTKILVCDDDIIFHNDFELLFDKNIRQIPYDWKILYLGFLGPREFENSFLETHDYNKPYITNFNFCDGSHCVGYDISIFNDLILKIKKFNKPFDNQLIDYINMNEILTFGFYPNLVIQDLTKSSIREINDNISDNYVNNYFLYNTNISSYDIQSMTDNKYNELLQKHN
jgi:hypothetical protein